MEMLKPMRVRFAYDRDEIEYLITATVSPGDPGCRYTKNGDGWPPTGPECEVERVTLDGAEVPSEPFWTDDVYEAAFKAADEATAPIDRES